MTLKDDQRHWRWHSGKILLCTNGIASNHVYLDLDSTLNNGEPLKSGLGVTRRARSVHR